MKELEVTLPDYDENTEVHCICCGELMKPHIETVNVKYKRHKIKVHNCRVFKCGYCLAQEIYSSKTAGMIEEAAWSAVEDLEG